MAGRGPPFLLLSPSPGEPSQQRNRVHLSPIPPYLEVEVGARHVSGMPTQADDLTVPDVVPSLDMDRREMGVDGENAAGVFQPDDLPKPRLGTGESDATSGHGSDLRPIRELEIHTSVETQRGPLGPKSEGRGYWGIYGPTGEEAAREKEEAAKKGDSQRPPHGLERPTRERAEGERVH